MAISKANSILKRVGPGDLFMVAAPTADPGTGTTATTADGYYGLFYTDSAAKKTLKAGVTPWITTDSSGIDLKIKPSTVDFDPNKGTKVKMVTGIDEATLDCVFYEVDPGHFVDLFGSQAADLISVAASTGKAARQIAIMGPQSYNTLYTILYRIASQVVPGEFLHYLFTVASVLADIEIKMSKKDEMKIKVSFQLQCSPYLFNSAGNGAVFITDDPTAPGL